MITTYQVQKGDTLGRLARRFYGAASRYPLIVAANHIADPDRLRVGQTLVIPDLPTAASALREEEPVAGTATALLSPRLAALNRDRLRRLHPGLARRGQSMVELCGLKGIGVLVTQGLRSWAEQDALYARGRTEPPMGRKYIITKARGGQSYHNFGLAFDIVVLDAVGKADWDDTHPAWNAAARIGKSVGLAWGGDWRGFKDRPHFQYAGGLSLAQCRVLFQGGGLAAVWAKVT
jgi:peptidoglycan L-alanyl-D-glutamate endopeptidase CwlK